MTKVTGPQNGKFITASFDSKDKKNNSKSRFPSLKTTKDLALLSIAGNEYCRGDFLCAIVQQAVATHQTEPGYSGVKGKTTFLIADEIYWHNLSGTSDSESDELKQKARELGEKYFEENLGAFLAPLGLTPEKFNDNYCTKSMDEKIAVINQLAADQGKNFEIVRWHTWVDQKNFKKTVTEILPLYSSVTGLKLPLEKSVEEFATRHTGEGGDPQLWSTRSRGYLTEESPSIMLLASTLGYNFIIYPGSILPPFVATKEYFVVEKHAPHIEKGMNVEDKCFHDKHSIHVDNPFLLANWLEVNFKRSHENLAIAREKNVKEEKRKAEEIDEVTKVQQTPNPTKTESYSSAVSFFSPKRDKTIGSRAAICPALTSSKGEGAAPSQSEKVGMTLECMPSKNEKIEMTLELIPSEGENEMVLKRIHPRKLTPSEISGKELASSITTGISRAIQKELLSKKDQAVESNATPLTQIWEGITKGVLAADLPVSEKIGFLTELVGGFMDRQVSEEEATAYPKLTAKRA